MGLSALMLLIALVAVLTASGYEIFVMMFGDLSLSKVPSKLDIKIFQSTESLI